MASFDVRQTPKIASRLLFLAAVAVPHAGFSQPVFESFADDEQQQLVEKIQEVLSQDGPNSTELISPFTALGLVYQEDGEHGLAIAAIERALDVVRANYGLHSLDQAPLIRQLIANEESRDNITAAWDLEQELLALVGRHPEDLRTVPILREIADKRMALLRRYLAGSSIPPEIILGGYYGAAERPSGSKGVAARSILADAWGNYSSAISVLLGQGLYASDELRELEMELVDSSYRLGYLHVRAYEIGRQSLRRLLSYDVAKSEPWLTRLNALLQVADWDLLFRHNGLALETYEQVFEQLRQKRIAPESIEQIFSPEIPVVIPTFVPNPLIADETPESLGYIDVAFDITKYGNARQIEILDTTTNATDDAKKRLISLISHSMFRPRVTAGEFARRSPIVMRYYLNE